MSWNFALLAADKPSLKAEARKRFTQYHKEGEPAHATMTAVADALDKIVHEFGHHESRGFLLETNGHIDTGGHCSCSIVLKHVEVVAKSP
jgi:hypothetical protein